jgi:hypothetical protein
MCHLYIFFAMKELVSFLSSLVSRPSKCTSEKKTRKRTRAREQYDEEEKVDRGGFALFFLKFRVLVLFLCFCWCGKEPAFAGETRLFALRRRTSPAARRERASEIVSRGLSRTRATSLSCSSCSSSSSLLHTKKQFFPVWGRGNNKRWRRRALLLLRSLVSSACESSSRADFPRRSCS